MKTVTALLCLMPLAALATPIEKGAKVQIDYTFCHDDSESWVSGLNIDLDPHPVVLAPEATMSLSVSFELLQELAAGANADMVLAKGGAEIPCTDFGLNFPLGTCNYDINDLLVYFADLICPDNVPEGQACELPLMPGSYFGGTPLEVVFPADLSPIVVAIVAGDYDVTVHVNDVDSNELACLNLQFSLVAPEAA